jgi:hypothetical protein
MLPRFSIIQNFIREFLENERKSKMSSFFPFQALLYRMLPSGGKAVRMGEHSPIEFICSKIYSPLLRFRQRNFE